MRAIFSHCRFPTMICICAVAADCAIQYGSPSVPPIDFMLVLHPHENRRTVGTARILKYCLARSLRSIISDGADLDSRIGSFQKPPILLFPGGEPITDNIAPRSDIVILDGTWTEAKAMFRESPWLKSLPRYSFKSEKPSRYKIRRQPAQHCLSSLESVVEVLKLDPASEPLRKTLLAIFDYRIAQQIAFCDSNNAVTASPAPALAHCRLRAVRSDSRRRPYPSQAAGLQPA